MASKRRHSELIQDQCAETREPLCAGCWVIVAHPDLDRPLALGLVGDGPTYGHFDGHAIGEVWSLTDGSRHPVGALTRVDLVEVIRDGISVAADIRTAGQSKEHDITALRVHRAACLARVTLGRGPTASNIPDEQWGDLVNLILTDDEVARAEDAWRDFARVSLPRLLCNLRDAGALWLASQPGWKPGAGIPHQQWRDK